MNNRRIVVTGDTHGTFWRLSMWCHENPGTTKDDIMIILGDAGVNFWGYVRDREKKQQLASLPITFLCIHGNHEMRPESLDYYRETDFCGGRAYIEDEFPNIIFAKDGEIYELNGLKTLVLGGAYSVDKSYRLQFNLPWFRDEQPSDQIKEFAEKQLNRCGWKVDVVLSHTAPLQYEPTETFIPGLDQSGIDKSTEIWLDEIESKLDYKYWFCGHFHTVKQEKKVFFLFENYITFPVKED